MIMGRLRVAAVALVLVSLTGCGRGPQVAADNPGTPATWRLASPRDPQATALEIEVVAGGCLNPDGPSDIMPVKSIDVVEASDDVEISVVLGPVPDAGLDRCCDEEGVCIFPLVGFGSMHTVQLASPLGERTLIDPACDEKKFRGGSCEHPAR